LILIVNPAAAGGRAGRAWPGVANRLRSAGLIFDAVLTEAPGDASRTARDAAEDHDLVVAVGGDGTVNEVVNGILEQASSRRPCLGILPLGTGTDLCRGLGIPLDPVVAAGVLGGGRIRRIDAGRVTCAGRDGLHTSYFLNIADAGIGGDVADFVNGGFKVINGAITFTLAAVITLMRWRNPCLELNLDGDAMKVTAQQVVVANSRYYGGGMHIAPQALPDDGHFDVVINGDLGRLETIRLLGKVRNGAHMSHPKMERRLARRVEVRSERRVGVDADGERPGDLPAVFEIVPAAIDVMVPGS
jgi:diacylglycerol kinase (ATP)